MALPAVCTPSFSQTVGPGALGATVSLTSGAYSTVSPLQISTTTGFALSVTGTASLAIMPGSVLLQTAGNGTGAHAMFVGGNGLVTGGTGLTITTTGTSAVGIATGGTASVTLAGAGIHTSGGYALPGGGAGGVVAAYGVASTQASTVRLTGGSILTEGAGAIGAFASGGTIVLDSTSVETRATTAALNGATQFGAVGVRGTGGGHITMTGGSILTAGQLAYGVGASSSAAVSLSGTSVRTAGSSAVGVDVGGAASSVSLTNLGISTSGGAADGLRAGLSSAGGTITMTGGSIGVTGASAYGAVAYGAGSITIVGATVTAGANASNGLYAPGSNPGGVIIARDSAISVSGVTGSGAFAQGLGSAILIDNTDVETSKASGFGARALAQAAVNVSNGSTITTRQDNSAGMFADQTSTATFNDSTMQTLGRFSFGLYSQGGSSIGTTGSTIVTQGDGANGLYAVGTSAGTQITGDRLAVETFGANSHGARTVFGSTIKLANSTLTTHGAGANGVDMYAATGVTNVFSASDSEIKAAASVINAWGGTAEITLTNVRASSQAGQFLTVGAAPTATPLFAAADAEYTPPAVPGTAADPVIANLVAAGSTLVGNSTVGSGDTANVTLRGASTLTGAFASSGVANMDIREGSTWNLTGDSNLTTLTASNSQILFALPSPAQAGGPVAFKTLRVNSYTGTGSTIAINTVLGADNAPSDKLVLDAGTASGNTALRVANAGGTGAQTVSNGILVVDAINGARTDAGAFSLNGRAVAGPYEYRLFRGGAGDANPDAWYLRSEREPDAPVPAGSAVPPGPPAPLFRPEVAAYLANQQLAGQMFVHSLHDRLGEPQFIEGQGFDVASDTPRSGWLRVVGNWGNSRSKDGSLKASTDAVLLHGGLELASWRLAEGNGRVHGGVMASYGNASTDAEAAGNPARATGSVQGTSVGAYGTWYRNDEKRLGVYVDTWLQYGRFNNRVDGELMPRVNYDAHGLAVSGELGYALALGERWVLEPQAQLIYLNYDADDVIDASGTRIAGANSDGVITRLGVRTHRTFLRDDGLSVQVYGTVNWWHSSLNDAIRFNQTPVDGMYPADRLELKLGANADLGRRWVGWGNVGVSWGRQDYRDYAARVGIKRTW